MKDFQVVDFRLRTAPSPVRGDSFASRNVFSESLQPRSIRDV